MANDLSIKSTVALPSGAGSIPIVGLGVLASSHCAQSVLAALKAGYRHLDTAQIYHNEHETGSALTTFLSQDSTVKRSDVFVCSKLWEVDLSRPDMPKSFDEMVNGSWTLNCLEAGHTAFSREGALDGVNRSLNASGLDYLDLYLLHTPRPGPKARLEAWLGLQDALKAGKVRAIGVSNWKPQHIEDIMSHPEVSVLPAVNQIEFHPWNQQREIIKYCKGKGIVVTAYSPLAQGKYLGDGAIKRIAEKHGKSPAQVVLRWCLQQGVVIIPKSDSEQRIKQNVDLFGWSLDEADLESIKALDRGQEANIGEWDPFAWD